MAEKIKHGNLTDNKGLRDKILENAGGGFFLILGSADAVAEGVGKFARKPRESSGTIYHLAKITTFMTVEWAANRAANYLRREENDEPDTGLRAVRTDTDTSISSSDAMSPPDRITIGAVNQGGQGRTRADLPDPHEALRRLPGN